MAPAQEQPATQQRDWELEREVRDLGALCEQKSRQLGHHERVMKMEMADIRRLADEGDAVAIAAVNLVEREAAQRATKAAKARSDLRYGPCIELAYRLVRERVPASGQWPSRRQARLAVEDAVLSSEAGKKVGLSKDQASKTIEKWLREMPDHDKVIRPRTTRKAGS
ncbi:hypothetical protein CEY09_05460 [Achromobacter marplatensis]|nr:hypothetical protein CEY09_05460 [Achromobacter marplatensis]